MFASDVSPDSSQKLSLGPSPSPSLSISSSSSSSLPVSSQNSSVEEVTINYNGSSLTLQRTGGKPGGKTKSSQYNGFFTDQKTGQGYLLKQPDQKKLEGRIELLTEPLAGVVLQGCKDAKLIKPEDQASFICADWAELPDKSYVVIQPIAKGMTELFKHLYKGTAHANDKDRHPAFEVIEYEKGNNLYLKVSELEPGLDQLATIILWALITGNNSIHSGNIGYRKKTGAEVKEGKSDVDSVPQEAEDEEFEIIEAHDLACDMEWLLFDLGAAFRFFCHPGNKKALDPYEYQFSFRAFTKGYIYYYLKIPGLWDKISKQAQDLFKQLALINGEQAFIQIFEAASQKIPAAVLADGRQAEMKEYLCVDPGEAKVFAQEMGRTMHQRLVDITGLSKDRVFTLEIETLRMQQQEHAKHLAILEQERQKEREKQEIEHKRKAEELLSEKKKEKKEKEKAIDTLAQKEEIIARQELELKKEQEELESQQDITAQLQFHIEQQQLLISLEKKQQEAQRDLQQFQLAEIRYQSHIRNYAEQKEGCNDAMTICFGFFGIGGCSAVGIISYCGGLAIAGIWLVGATCVVPLLAAMYGFYCYSKAKQVENMRMEAENLRTDLLENKDESSKKTTQRLFELMAAVELLGSVSVNQKQQLYHQLRMVAGKNKESKGDIFKTAFQDRIAELKSAEQATQVSFFGLFGRRPNQDFIEVLGKFPQEEKSFFNELIVH